MQAFTVEELSFTYPGAERAVFEGAGFSIPVGSITALLGPNGCGKSTLLSLFCGVLKPKHGHIRLFDKPLDAYSKRELGRTVAFVPQKEHIPFEYSIEEYVLLGRNPHLPPLGLPGVGDRRIARRAITAGGLGGKTEDSINHLSGGERQLLMIARALAQRPKCIILDEPTSHLDLANKAKLLDILHRLNDSGVTVVFSTHEPDVANGSATYAVLLVRGAVFTAGPGADVMTEGNLSRVYGMPVRVKTLDGYSVSVWNRMRDLFQIDGTVIQESIDESVLSGYYREDDSEDDNKDDEGFRE